MAFFVRRDIDETEQFVAKADRARQQFPLRELFRGGQALIDQDQNAPGTRHGVVQPRQQAVHLGTGSFFVQRGTQGRGQAGRIGHRSVTFSSLRAEYRSITRQSEHILRRSRASPWNMAWPDRRPSIASMACTVPKGLLQRMQA